MYDIEPSTDVKVNRHLRVVESYIQLISNLPVRLVRGPGFETYLSLLQGPMTSAISGGEPVTDVALRDIDTLITRTCIGYMNYLRTFMSSGADASDTNRIELQDKFLGQQASPVQQSIPQDLAKRIYAFFRGGYTRYDRERACNELKGLAQDARNFCVSFVMHVDPVPPNTPTPFLNDYLAKSIDPQIEELCSRGSYRDYALPLLTLLFSIAKINKDDRSREYDVVNPEVATILSGCRITDSLMAVLPVPNLDFIVSLSDGDAPVISTRALTYASAIYNAIQD